MMSFGQNNYSMSFDGNDDYVELTDIDLLQDFTISAWIKTDDISSYQNIVSKYVNAPEPGGYALIISDQGNFYAHTGLGVTPTTFCATNTLANINQWNYISLTLDAGLLSFYLNGQFIHSCNGLNNSPNTTSNTFIGKAAHGWTEMFDGLIDDVSIWNTPLTEQEIQQYMNCPPTGTETGLVGYWNFEEGIGTTAYDLTSNGNDGTINGATYSTDVPIQNCCTTDTSYTDITTCDSTYLWNDSTYNQSGIYSYDGNIDNDYSMSFDGVDDYVTGTSGLDLLFTETNEMTLSAWIKPSTLNSQQFIFTHNDGVSDGSNYGLILSDGKIYFVAGPSWFESEGVNVSENQLIIDVWSHITVSYDGNAIRFYLNGQLDFENYVYDEFEDNWSGTFHIGQRGDGQYKFNGNIDNINLWNQSLTQQEIQQYMDCPPTGTETGLVGYWKFEEGSGTTAIDLTPNGNDGTINGATYSTDVPVQNCNLTNAAGCDSIAVLNLTLNNPSSSTDVIIACDSYSWLDGNTYTASNNSATYTTTNAEGCDSTITLDLTINSQSTSLIIETACDFYIAPDGQVYTSTGSYSSTVQNAASCDSVISIDLTIDPLPNNAVIQNGATLTATQTVAAYQWVDCDNGNAPIVGEVNQSFTPISTGNYAVIVNVNGCSNTSECRLVDFTGINELNNTLKQLIKIVDVLGRETPFKPNTPLLYIYNDGTVERKMIIKE